MDLPLQSKLELFSAHPEAPCLPQPPPATPHPPQAAAVVDVASHPPMPGDKERG